MQELSCRKIMKNISPYFNVEVEKKEVTYTEANIFKTAQKTKELSHFSVLHRKITHQK